MKQRGIPEQLIEVWRARQGENLLPVQRQAVLRGLLGAGIDRDEDSNLIITAPTSTGKSFCAELAAARALMARRKVLFLFPLKSLAEQKYRELSECYSPLGLKCLIATGDHPENDSAFLRGDFHLAVSIYEKCDLLLTTCLDALRTIALLVIDELQTLADPKRGAILEMLLTKVRASSYCPRILALSAVIDHDAAVLLARWLGANLIEEHTRPVELERGVAVDGSVRLRSYNSGEERFEPFARFEPSEDPFAALVRHLKTQSGSAIVFLKSRRDTVDAAFRMASISGWTAAGGALERLEEEESSVLNRSLQQVLAHGVAFHNADLSPLQRSAVEAAFVSREVKVLFATTTLALGVNLPADIVYLETMKYQSGRYDDRPGLAPITRAEFDNMTGRAGRLGWTSDRPGKAIILAESEFDREILWRTYVAPDALESFSSALNGYPPEDVVLSLIVCGLASSIEQLRESLSHSYLCHTEESLFQKRFKTESVLARLAERRLIRHDSTGCIEATPLGRAVAQAGLTCEQAAYFERVLDKPFPQTAFGWFYAALSAPGWDLPPSVLTRTEYRTNAAVRMLYQRFDHSVEEVEALLPEEHRRRPLPYRQAAVLKVCLILEEWRQLADLQQLEEQYQMHVGQILSLGDTAAHLLAGLARLIATCDHESRTPGLLTEYQFSLRHGLPAELQELHGHFSGILGRLDFGRLYRAGVGDITGLVTLSEDQLKELIGSEKKRCKLIKEIESFRQEVHMKPMTAFAGGVATRLPEEIEIDGSYEADRYLVRINGLPVRLTGKSFKYLTKLAWSRLSRDGGWVYKEDLEVGFNQARYLYRLKNEIAAGFPTDWQIFENNRLGYYRLDLRPDRIRINFDNLKSFPDYELQRLADGFPGRSVSSDRSLPS